ncbi:P-loop containing nucleoside triphosphate hydrolase protein [Atractiella rhizophila]|nr:P-loop containing nucleoside triphosphate hydrolase protein [Atractiella rhizophila]
MLDIASIVTTGGIVIWSKQYAPQQSASLLGSLSSVLISSSVEEDVSKHSVLQTPSHTLLYTLSNSLELIFVIAYSRILRLEYVEELIQRMKEIFEQLCGGLVQDILQQSKPNLWGKDVWKGIVDIWEPVWESMLRDAEMSSTKNRYSRPRAEPAVLTSADGSTARNIAALRHRQKGGKRNGKKGSGSEAETAGSESEPSRKKGKGKEKRTWGTGHVTADDIASFDFSETSTPTKEEPVNNFIDPNFKLSASSGKYEVAEVGDAVPPPPVNNGASFSAKLSGFISSIGNSNKTLTAQDLQGPIGAMKTHLMDKNVAQEVATKICEAVVKSLEGKKVSGWGGVDAAVRSAMESILTAILTPTTSTDILLSITRKKQASADLSMPYAITFVGVNGVGKSTNLAKVAFWLIQNRLRVLIAACDTFRSGAVEQLRVHVRNLQKLGDELRVNENVAELFEKGYGKDAAGIAKDALAYGRDNKFDVVLIDTAGRMQDNEPLMRALAKLVSVNNPDKIVFVGEALVGNEAVDQLTKFNRALRDFSTSSSNPRGVDGMILTKFDTVSDQVGAAVSMTYVTGQPIFFVGTGQTYSDLRRQVPFLK